MAKKFIENVQREMGVKVFMLVAYKNSTGESALAKSVGIHVVGTIYEAQKSYKV